MCKMQERAVTPLSQGCEDELDLGCEAPRTNLALDSFPSAQGPLPLSSYPLYMFANVHACAHIHTHT